MQVIPSDLEGKNSIFFRRSFFPLNALGMPSFNNSVCNLGVSACSNLVDTNTPLKNVWVDPMIWLLKQSYLMPLFSSLLSWRVCMLVVPTSTTEHPTTLPCQRRVKWSDFKEGWRQALFSNLKSPASYMWTFIIKISGVYPNIYLSKHTVQKSRNMIQKYEQGKIGLLFFDMWC